MRHFQISSKSFGLFCFLGIALLYLGGGHGYGHCAATSVHVVDVDRALKSSAAAKAAQDHVVEVRKALEKGFDELRKAWDNQPEEKRQEILHEGSAALTRQLNAERQAAQGVVAKMMLDAVKDWRQKNRADLVLPRQNILDAADAIDITDAIIKAMDAKKPEFAPLPVITVHTPEQEKDAKARLEK